MQLYLFCPRTLRTNGQRCASSPVRGDIQRSPLGSSPSPNGETHANTSSRPSLLHRSTSAPEADRLPMNCSFVQQRPHCVHGFIPRLYPASVSLPRLHGLTRLSRDLRNGLPVRTGLPYCQRVESPDEASATCLSYESRPPSARLGLYGRAVGPRLLRTGCDKYSSDLDLCRRASGTNHLGAKLSGTVRR